MSKDPSVYHCIVRDAKMKAFNVRCALSNQPEHVQRLNFFGILDARVPKALFDVDDCFIIANGQVPEIGQAIKMMFLDFSCLLAGQLQRIAKMDGINVPTLINYYLTKFSIRNLAPFIQLHILLREVEAQPDVSKNQGIRLKGTWLGLVGNDYMSVLKYFSLIASFPLALLEECEFKGHGDGEYSIKDYQKYVEKVGISSTEPRNKEEKKSMCFISFNIPGKKKNPEPPRLNNQHYEGVLKRVRDNAEMLNQNFNLTVTQNNIISIKF